MKRILSVLLCLALMLGALPAAYGATKTASASGGDMLLRVGYSPFTGLFSPFYSQTAYDQDAAAMTQINLLTSDRNGAIVTGGIRGETRSYGGTDYTYYGPADLVITENADGTVYYDFTLRRDLKFSDGTPVTADDVIFSMYVLSDPTYDGASGFRALPIMGMEAYRAGMDTLYELLVNAGRGNADFSLWTEALQTTFWAASDAAFLALARDIVDYCITNYGSYGAVDVASAASLWGFSLEEGAAVEDFAEAIREAYDDDAANAISVEGTGKAADEYFPTLYDYTGVGIQTGESAPNIEGIRKTGDYSLRIVTDYADATTLYQLAVAIAPLHYYGSRALYDYEGNSFGFPKGDLSSVRAKTSAPMGAGPYRFMGYADGVISYEANEYYYKGAPMTRFVEFVEINNDNEKISGVINGDLDITDPSFSTSTVSAIKRANSNGELTGDTIATATVDNLGYGYVGQNAVNVKVGSDPGSAASRALRKAFATVFAVYRDAAIASYYGDRATVINYPISNTSWAAPHPGDEGYQTAYSVDKDGDPIYTPGMSAEEKYAAALNAALGFFEEAGYTIENGKLVAAPAGARLAYTFWIPGDGEGDHPAFMICSRAAQALETIGMTLNIRDLSNSAELWDSLSDIQVDMWAAAWGSVVDPDMTQIYFSDAANGPTAGGGGNPLGGPEQGGSNYMYCIADQELDDLILAARASTDQAYRKTLYKQCLDIIIDWACEVPTYQRQNAFIFSSERVDMSTVTPNITTFYGWMAEIEKLEAQIPSLHITSQPQDAEGELNEYVSFHVEAVGEGLTYMWQSNASGVWKNTYFATSKTDTLVAKATAARNGVQYRCVVRNAEGAEKITRPAALRVANWTPLEILVQPESYWGALNEYASFHVEAVGTGLTYMWQSDVSGKWVNTSFAGSKTDTLRVKITEARSGAQYRCIVTDAAGEYLISQPAELWINFPELTITAQPEDFTGELGEYATFRVEAEGEGVTYLWQTWNGAKWANTSFATSKQATLSVKITEARDGKQYRCVVRDAYGTQAISEAATLHVAPSGPSISGQPEDFTGALNSYATFHVEAVGEGLTYMWQSNASGDWKNTSFATSKTDTLSVKITEARDGVQYRCVVTDASGNSVISEAATLHVAS